ncbi:MAG TPA: sigma-54-dependent Fis family transcriptional regulator, partial [Bacteroidetes bacterium]|nr:sigma-54-dependent Fis family transcriptional regulator [Bacteroidota bacterium]
VGSTRTLHVDVRIIAATNRNLLQMVNSHLFREDLYYRLDVFPIVVPPLREHREDIPLLLDHFITTYAAENGVLKPQISPAALHYLTTFDWPGNVRQLQHVVERMMILSNREIIDLEHVRALLKTEAVATFSRSAPNKTLKSVREYSEKEHILNILAETRGNVSKAAKILGVNRANLYRKMKGLGIES